MNSFEIDIQKSEFELILDSEQNFMRNDYWEQKFTGLSELEDSIVSNGFENENNSFNVKTAYEDIFGVEEEEEEKDEEYTIYENGERYFFEGANNLLEENVSKLENDQSHYLIKTETLEQTEKTETLEQTEKTETLDQTEKTETLEQTEKTENVSQESFGIWSELAKSVSLEELFPTLLHRIKEEAPSEDEDSNGTFLSGFENVEEMCDDFFYSMNNCDYNNTTNSSQEIDGPIELKREMSTYGERYSYEESEITSEEEFSEQYSAGDELWTYQRRIKRKDRKSSKSNVKKRNNHLKGAASKRNRDSLKKYRNTVENLISEDCNRREKCSSNQVDMFPGCSSSIVTRSTTAKRFILGDISNLVVETIHKPTTTRRVYRKKENKENVQEKPAPKRRMRYVGEQYRCNDCNYICVVQASFERHMKAHEQNKFVPLKFSCTVCGEDKDSKQEMKTHEASHKRGPYFSCDICNFITLQMKKLIQHRRMHTGERPHRCPYCEYRSARRDNLRSHVRRKHSVTTLLYDTFCAVYKDDGDDKKIKVVNNNSYYYK